jgi:outer membrane protein TolC
MSSSALFQRIHRPIASITRVAICLLFLATPSLCVADPENLNLEQVLQQVLDTYPSLQIAAKQVQRARLENARVEGQLSWALGAQAGVRRDLSFIGALSDQTEASANLQRKLTSGASVGLEGSYLHEDADAVLSPAFPNPVTTTRLDLSWRQPLLKGVNNPDYAQGLVGADAQLVIAEAGRRALRDQVAAQTADLFHAAGSTLARIQNAERAIERTQRLRKYIVSRTSMGLSEEKDQLQTDAQLQARIAERDVLLVVWKQQRTSLNRLMGRIWDAPLSPQTTQVFAVLPPEPAGLVKQVQENNPDLQRSQAQLRLAESAIMRKRDAAKDKLDFVVSYGNRTRSGDTVLGSAVDDSARVGGLRLEYGRVLERGGPDAELEQAVLDRDIAQEEISKTRDDLHYNLSGLLAEIDATQQALTSYRTSQAREEAKLKEAERRYRAGRVETDRLIQYETELYFAELSVAQQSIELARKHSQLDILRGTLWQRVGLQTDQHGGAVP